MALRLFGTYADTNAELWIDLDTQGRVTGGEFRNNTNVTGHVAISRAGTGVAVELDVPPGTTQFNIPSGRRFTFDDLAADWSFSVALRWP